MDHHGIGLTRREAQLEAALELVRSHLLESSYLLRRECMDLLSRIDRLLDAPSPCVLKYRLPEGTELVESVSDLPGVAGMSHGAFAVVPMLELPSCWLCVAPDSTGDITITEWETEAKAIWWLQRGFT